VSVPAREVGQADCDVGARVRAVRLARRRTLKQIASQVAISESFLSQVERGRTGVSVATLQRIAGALGVSVADLFTSAGDGMNSPLRREDRPTLNFGITLGRKYLLTPKALNLEVLEVELDPGGSTGDEAYSHGSSEELFFVISGRVRCQVADDVHELRAGDSIFYMSSTPHRVVNDGSEMAHVMWIMTPPSY
jgi:transcriptional regulator with XRE-family HTH domain